MVKLISVSTGVDGKSPEDLIAYVARVSNPDNQDKKETYPKLIKYLINHNHWSPFEMGSMTVEITTTRAIAAQILRHRSFSFQEFSLRYQEAGGVITSAARRQDSKNRQNSIDDLSDETKEWFREAQHDLAGQAFDYYYKALEKGIAKECARFLLPLNTSTTIYMAGTIRSWIHYITIRTDPSTQLEHRKIADECQEIFIKQFPNVSEALGW